MPISTATGTPSPASASLRAGRPHPSAPPNEQHHRVRRKRRWAEQAPPALRRMRKLGVTARLRVTHPKVSGMAATRCAIHCLNSGSVKGRKKVGLNRWLGLPTAWLHIACILLNEDIFYVCRSLWIHVPRHPAGAAFNGALHPAFCWWIAVSKQPMRVKEVATLLAQFVMARNRFWWLIHSRVSLSDWMDDADYSSLSTTINRYINFICEIIPVFIRVEDRRFIGGVAELYLI